MKILILAAMDKELTLLLNLLTDIKEIEVDSLLVYKGEIESKDIYLSKCGIGKVNSTINCLKLIKSLKPDYVINSGVAGGAGLPVGSILVPDSISYHDVWCGPGTKYGQAEGVPLFMKPSSKILEQTSQMNVERGLICSGDKFITTPEEIKLIRSHFPDVKAVDMESASIAQTCLIENIPFAIVRIVSDTPGEGENISQYQDFWTKAPEKTFEVLEQILSIL